MMPPHSPTASQAAARSAQTAEGITRPPGVTALALFFAAGALIAAASFVALLVPGSPLEPMWRLNPAAREGFRAMGAAAPVLMAAVSLSCLASALGLARRRLWGWRLAIGLLAVNLTGDLANALLRGDLRTLVGLPIGGAFLWYLTSEPRRTWFAGTPVRRDGR